MLPVKYAVEDERLIFAQDLKCGDVFAYGDRTYAVLGNVRDERRTITNIITVPLPLESGSDVVAFKLFRTINVQLLSRLPWQLRCIQGPDPNARELAELAKIRGQPE